MSIRLDPRRLQSLKQLAGEAGLRPGELVTQWVEARIDAERRGETGGPALPAERRDGDAVALLTARLDELMRRIVALEGSAPAQAEASGDGETSGAASAAPRRRGRPPKAAKPAATPATPSETAAQDNRAPRARGRVAPRRRATRGKKRVPLHEELAAILTERGEPLSAADLARAVTERGRYVPPRSGKALDSAAINSRVSNPHYRAQFVRSGGRIGLATVPR